MSDDPTPEEPESPASDESECQRKQRLADVFGDVLPDTTSDERDVDAPPESDGDAQDQWLRRQVPPHHG